MDIILHRNVNRRIKSDEMDSNLEYLENIYRRNELVLQNTLQIDDTSIFEIVDNTLNWDYINDGYYKKIEYGKYDNVISDIHVIYGLSFSCVIKGLYSLNSALHIIPETEISLYSYGNYSEGHPQMYKSINTSGIFSLVEKDGKLYLYTTSNIDYIIYDLSIIKISGYTYL